MTGSMRGAAAGQLGVVDQQLQAAPGDVDLDGVALVHERDQAADERLGRDVADAEAAGGAGETAVGDQCHLLAHALAVDERGGTQHLAHTGTAARAFVADHQHLVGLEEHIGRFAPGDDFAKDAKALHL